MAESSPPKVQARQVVIEWIETHLFCWYVILSDVLTDEQIYYKAK